MANLTWERRSSERLRTIYHARCPTSADEEMLVVIVNVTPEGCCLALNGATMRVGQAIIVRLETGHGLTGTVRWTRSGQAGVLFDTYLDPGQLDYLRREHSTFLSESDWSDTLQVRSLV